MSRQLIEKYRQRRDSEVNAVARAWGGRLSIALVYPNSYHQGMSNLGLQTVYQIINGRDDALCERFFLPDKEDLDEHFRTSFPLVSIESQRPLADFDLVAFSISFENDYVNLPTIFELGRLPLWRQERSEHDPLILCGGVCAFLNPEPLAEIMDALVVGEAEVILPSLIDCLVDAGKQPRDILKKGLSRLPGIYLPEGYQPRYTEGRLQAMDNAPGYPDKVARQWLAKLDDWQCQTCVATADTEFGNMHLVEVSRGCPRACRFCAAGFIYRPFREHSKTHLKKAVTIEGQTKGRVGLVAAAVSDYGDLVEVGKAVQEQGGEVSVSSVRIDAISPAQVKMLADSGHKTLALAPEAGSQRLRDVINKGIDEEQILNAVRLLAEGGVPNLKLYFMIGLPTETEEDVEAIAELTCQIRQVWQEIGRSKGHLGRLQLSLNPFVAKPWTPFQWAAMDKRKSLEKKYRLLQKALRALPNVDLNFESLRHAELQALLARGDRRIGKVLPLLAAGKTLKAACKEVQLDPDQYVYRERDPDECFPWEIIDQGVQRSHLWQEYTLALQSKPGHICHSGCRRCGMSC